MEEKPIVFVDTSIQVARLLREPEMKARIKTWLSQYKLKISSTVALQEFKRRVLRDLFYLLTKLNQTKSYRKALNYITSVLPSFYARKRQICLLALHNIMPGASDEELTERARLYLRTLLVTGEKRFRSDFDSILEGINCYWAKTPVREIRRYATYDFGDTKCSKSRGLCQVGTSLGAKLATCRRLHRFLENLPAKRQTAELAKAQGFLRKVVNAANLENIQEEEPCLAVGDLLIALESEGIPDFYTMNFKESQAFCDFLDQALAVRPNNPVRDEQIFTTSSKPWPDPL